MFSDNTLTPKEAIRLCALGALAMAPMRYSVLATSIRHFVSHVLGPSLDLMGTSIELLKFEGLVEPVDGKGMEDDAVLRITDKGRDEMTVLLGSNMRAAATELNKLIIALKFRFLHLLTPGEAQEQTDLMVEVVENELIRLEALRAHHADDPGHLVAWLDHDVALLKRRLTWLEDFRRRLGDAGP